MMKSWMRVGAVAVMAAALVGGPVAAQAAPVTPQAAAAKGGQPYTHLLTSKDWSTGGAYVAKGGAVTLQLSTLPKATEVLIEECEGGHDLGDVQLFSKPGATQTLATNVPKGTCFVMLLHPKTGKTGYQVSGTLTY
ncbi:hypothetical protein GCM10009804_55530 [Kribbella hippodromi]|uniref:Uncharacterized protein n=1 Tax=Kribbella hippodromi TaxID=434347 RepID=A0ABN2E1P0_9ACTN